MSVSSWIKAGLAAAALVMMSPAFATTFTIGGANADCDSLKQAFDAIAKNSTSCTTDDNKGDGNYTLELLSFYASKSAIPSSDPGTANPDEYKITAPLTVGYQDGSNNWVAVDVEIDVQRGQFDFGDNLLNNAVINTASGNRIFYVAPGSSLTLNNITLDGGVDPANATGPLQLTGHGQNGGVVYVDDGASLTLDKGTLITHGYANNGGGIFLAGDSDLSITDSKINANTAKNNGGAIATSNSGVKRIGAVRFNLMNNAATSGKGGAIFLDGKNAAQSRGVLLLSNGTIYGNESSGDGAAVYVGANKGVSGIRTKILNVTIVGNTGVGNTHTSSLAYEQICHDSSFGAANCSVLGKPGIPDNNKPGDWNDAPKKFRVDTLKNSVVMATGATDCTLVGSNDSIDLYVENQYSAIQTVGGVHSCPAAEKTVFKFNGSPYDMEHSKLWVLTGKNGQCDPAHAAACLPIDFGKSAYHLDGFIPTPAFFTQMGAPNGNISLLRAGKNCTSTDLRNSDRLTHCDVGAVEFQFATATPDSLSSGIKSGSPIWIDVLRNDVKDAGINCNNVTAGKCMTVVMQPQYGGVATVAFIKPLKRGEGFTQSDVVSCAVDNIPDSNSVNRIYSCTPPVDLCQQSNPQQCFNSGYTYPILKFVSPGGFHGTSLFAYQLSKNALIPAQGSATGNDLRADVTVLASPPDTFTSSNVYDDHGIGGFQGGGIGLWGVFSMFVLGLLRWLSPLIRYKCDLHRYTLKRAVLCKKLAQCGGALLLLSVCGVAHAELDQAITVNAFDGNASPAAVDPGIRGDGLCSLEEALENTRNIGAHINTDCEFGTPSRDTIDFSEPGAITLQGPLEINNANGVIIQGKGVGETIINGNNKYRVTSRSGITLKYLTIENGSATISAQGIPGIGGAGRGGAILTNASLTLDHVELKNNTADLAGGAVYLLYGQPNGYQFNLTGSYVHGNTVTNGDGGAIATTDLARKATLSIWGTTFEQNAAKKTGTSQAADGGLGGALFVNLAEHSQLSVVNSVFVNNESALDSAAKWKTGTIDLGNSNPSAGVFILNSTFNNHGVNGNSRILTVQNGATSTNMSNVNVSHSVFVGGGLWCASSVAANDAFETFAYNRYDNIFNGDLATCKYTPSTDNEQHQATDILKALGHYQDPDAYGTSTWISAYSNAPGLSAAAGTTADYLPPLYQLDKTKSAILVDQGNDNSEVTNQLGASDKCRKTDMRGKSRTAGAACDIGAFELQVITANDDDANTLTSRSDGVKMTSRQARLTTWSNDLPSEGSTIVSSKDEHWTNTIGLLKKNGNIVKLGGANPQPVNIEDLASGTYTDSSASPSNITITAGTDINTQTLGIEGTIRWVKRQGGTPEPCDTYGNCGVLIDITHVGANSNLVCPDSNSPTVKIPYVVYDNTGHMAKAVMNITVQNIVPQFSPSVVTAYTDPNKDIKIPLDVVDPDGTVKSVVIAENGAASFSTPLTPKKGSDGWYVVYHHKDASKSFTDHFTIQAEDDCGGTSTLRVNVKFNNPHGFGVSSAGGIGWGIVLLIGLGWVRRRRWAA